MATTILQNGDSTAKTARERRHRWADVLVFASLWLVIPGVFRLIMLVDWLDTGLPGATGDGVLLGMFFGLLQDGFIAFQAMVVMLLCRRFLPGLVWLWLTGAMFVAYTTWSLFDLLLYLSIDLRITSSFLHFLLDAETFWSSVEDAGLWALFGGLSAILVAAVLLMRRLRPRLERIHFDQQQALAGIIVGVSAIGSVTLGPGELMYMSNNPALSDQVNAGRLLLGIEDPLIELAEDTDGDTIKPMMPRAEHSVAPLPFLYPLYRTTREFEGKKLFDLRLEDGEQPHVVLLVLESFRGVDVGVLGGEHDVTPRFDQLSTEGILFDSFYASGVQTTRAVLALLFGIPPRFTEESVQADSEPPNLRGMADIMHDAGYTTAYLHNGELDFERMGPFFEEHGYDEVVGHLDLLDINPDASSFSWGVHDEHLMEYVLDWLEEKDDAGEPAFVTAFTISNHHPWDLPDDWDPIDLEVSDQKTYGKFLRAMHYTDAALGQFVAGLRDRGLAENTILIVTADTSQAMGDRYDSYNVSRALYEENVHVPLLLIADGRIEPGVVSEPGSQIDVLPTLLDLLSLSGPHHSLGSSLRRALPERQAVFSSPFALRYQGLREGRWKYWYVLRSDTAHLYDMESDPDEERNLVDDEPSIAARLKLDLARRHRFIRSLYEQNRFAPPR